jgi:hypothetical protein
MNSSHDAPPCRIPLTTLQCTSLTRPGVPPLLLHASPRESRETSSHAAETACMGGADSVLTPTTRNRLSNPVSRPDAAEGGTRVRLTRLWSSVHVRVPWIRAERRFCQPWLQAQQLPNFDQPDSPRRFQALCAISCLLSWCREVRSGVVVVVSPITCTHVATPLQC